MALEVCAGGVVFKRVNGVPEYLLIQGRTTKWWVFPKGHVEDGESLIETAKREVFEETGIRDMQEIQGYLQTISFVNHKGNTKEVHHFLFETKEEQVKISEEHIDFKWLNFEDAYKLVDHENQKRVLKKAQETILDG